MDKREQAIRDVAMIARNAIDKIIEMERRPWLSLDDDEYQTILGQLGDAGLLAFYTLIEAKLKEKNTWAD
jgi:hypothetical protein